MDTKKLLLLTVILLLFALPFAVADSVASLVAHYKNAKQEYQELRAEFDACEEADDDCEDIEEDLLDAAIDYAEAGIEMMLAYIDYTDSSELAEEKETLEQALEDLDYVETKEDFDEVIASVKSAWSTAIPDVKKKTVEGLKNEVADLVSKGKLIDAKLDCGIENLETSSSDLHDAYTSFSEDIAEAEEHMEQAEALMKSDGDVDAILEYVKKSQEALKNSREPLDKATSVLEAQGGSFCAEVTLEEEEKETEVEEEAEEEEEGEEETEEAEEEDIDALVDEYGLDTYYSDAKDALENLIEYIEEKQDDGYDTSEADDVLAQAEAYLAEAEELILKEGGKGALSRLFNAKQTAERGLLSDYYSLRTGAAYATGDFAAFVSCMESASYTYQREDCYDDYGISDNTQEEIETCLDNAVTTAQEEECYAEAEDEAEKQVSADAEELQERIDVLEEQLEDLEGNVTDLYDALAATGEDSSSSEYQAIDADIDDLLQDVQQANEDYLQQFEDIETLIDNERYDDADDDLDSVESEIEDYIEDMENEIEDIQQDIDLL